MRHYSFLLLAVFFTVASVAQPVIPLTSPLAWPGTTSYDVSIPTPEQILGHRIGTRHTIPSEVVTYFQAVAAASDRVTLRQHGRTYEGRPLIHAIVTTPERQSQLDRLQQNHQRLFSDAAGFSESELKETPAVAYMGYSIHGNEASGTEAAILTLYHLAAGQGPAVEAVLQNVVTIIDPMFNPDGRDRFTDWANRNRGAVSTSDPQDREHNEPWPNGRTNHYWFDLNRDWLPAQHPESQARLELFYNWRPQVLTDYHEMGSDATFFFQPGIPSRTNPQTPARNQELTGLITDYSAKALDRIGSLYYTRESFDDFYYGKGSTYPDVNGSVGILFEQASSRALNREISGGEINYGFSIRNQLTASLATLDAISELREQLLTHTRDFYSGSSAFAKTLPTKAYLLPLKHQTTRATELANLLRRHRINVFPITGKVNAQGKTYAAGEALVIPLDQTQSRLISAIMEPNTSFEDSLFYDVSTWTLPLAFDLDVERLSVLPKGQYDESKVTSSSAANFTEFRGGALLGDLENAYAYVFPYSGYFAPRAVFKIVAQGGHARLLNEPTSVLVDGKEVALGRGAIVVPIVQNPIGAEKVNALVANIVEEDGLTVYAVATGLTPSGPDLGGRSTSLLKQPKVALITGAGADVYAAGEAWHLLSERMQMPVSLIDVDRVGRVDLSRYTHIAMTGGRYTDLDVEALKKWVLQGGTLLASHTAAPWAVDKGLTTLTEAKLNVDSLLLARKLPYAQLEDAEGAQYIGGAILSVELDATHPLAYGLSEASNPAKAQLPMFRQHQRFFQQSKIPGANVGHYSADPLASGYLSAERRKQGGNKAAIVEQSLGRGRVILYFDNPNFRAFWRGSERVWLNGLILR